ncbi:MAG: type II secretion system protein [bacterium]|nr:type II secretion system protein [bacterium]
MQKGKRKGKGKAGFTLVELVVTLTITGLLAGLLMTAIQQPLLAYEDVARRARLVDGAENALVHVTRETRSALPNSLRLTGGSRTLEFIPTRDGARYRRQPGVNPSTIDHTAASDVLAFTGDDSWNLLGRLQDLSFSYGVPLGAGFRIAIYPTDTGVYASAAADTTPSRVTPSTTTITVSDDGDEDQLGLSAAFDFLLESPDQRLYLIEAPLTYRCDLGAGTLTRFSGYGFHSTQPDNPAAAPLTSGSSALVVEGVSVCSFTYLAGTSSRSGLLTMELGVTEGTETVTLLHQVHVENAP